MEKLWQFLKPNPKRIGVAILIWILLWVVSYFFIAKCFLADCMSNGQMTSCCGSLENSVAEFFYRVKISFPVIAYLLSCKLTK